MTRLGYHPASWLHSTQPQARTTYIAMMAVNEMEESICNRPGHAILRAKRVAPLKTNSLSMMTAMLLCVHGQGHAYGKHFNNLLGLPTLGGGWSVKGHFHFVLTKTPQPLM